MALKIGLAIVWGEVEGEWVNDPNLLTLNNIE